MFCMHCGKQLEDGSRFCMYCGKPLEEAPVEEPAEETIAAAPVADIPLETAPAADPEATMAADPIVIPASQTPLDPQDDFYVNLPPVPEVPQPEPEVVPQDANVYTDPVPAAPKKEKKAKKKGKAGPIIAIILVLLLLIGGGVGYYLYTQQVYEENLAAYDAAELLLNKRDYDGALAGFQDLGDFEDAADRAEELEQLQADYDAALALLDEQKFEEAADAFKALGNYRDSKNYVDNEIDYRKACALMTGAAAGSESEAQEQYLEAADIFAELDDYADSADLASECWLNAALIELGWEDYDDAMSYLDMLNPADQTTLRDAYAELCADEAFLLALSDAFVLWYDDSDLYATGEELQLAMDMIEPYANAYFDDDSLAGVYNDYMNSMGVMYSTVLSDGSVDDVAEYYRGMYLLYCLADDLYYNYGVFADDEALRSTFVGVSDYPYAYWKIEESLNKWWDGDGSSAEMMDDGHYYATYTNDTGVSYTLYALIYFYGEDGSLLEEGDWMEIYVAKGATVYIPTIPTTISDNDWYSWYMYWDYEYAG